MRNQLVLVFAIVMTAAGLFLANFRRSELPAYTPDRTTASPGPAATAAAAVKPFAVPKLPSADAPKAPASPEDPGAEDRTQLTFTVSSYAPDKDSPPVFQEAFRGPVCVKIINPEGLAIVTKYMTEAEAGEYAKYYAYAALFLKSSCPRYAAAMSPVSFVKDDGTGVSQESIYGFIFFDGVQDPHVLGSINTAREEYLEYFRDLAGNKQH